MYDTLPSIKEGLPDSGHHPESALVTMIRL